MKKFSVLIYLTFISATSLSRCFTPQVNVLRLPIGIELIPKTDQLQLSNPLWSPDGKMIVAGIIKYPMPHFCLSCETPYAELYLISPSTHSITSFLREDYADFSVKSWTPDSKKVAVRSSGDSLGRGVFLIDINDPRSITVTKYFSDRTTFDWSRDGGKIVVFDWVVYTRRELRIIDLIAGKETLLYTITGTNSEHIELSVPSLSPDGRTVAFSYGKGSGDYHSVDTEIYFIDVETGQLIQFTHDVSNDNDSPIFSPDGNLIAYQKFYKDKLERRTVIVELDSGCEWEIPLADAYSSSWAPDSRKLVIGGFGIYIVDLNELFGNEFANGAACP